MSGPGPRRILTDEFSKWLTITTGKFFSPNGRARRRKSSGKQT